MAGMFENWGQILDWLALVGRVTFALTSVFCVIYFRLWRPGWPTHPAKIKVPYAGWIVAAILAFVFIMLAVLISRDPLAPR
jgi:hypothetical protein